MPIKEPDYPKPMYKPDCDPVYARDNKHEDQLASEGWSPHYITREYPKMLFSADSRGTLEVGSQAEEAQARSEGWLAEPRAEHYGEPAAPNNGAYPLPGPELGSPAALQAQIVAMQQQMAEQSKLITTLLLDGASAKSDKDPKSKSAKAKE